MKRAASALLAAAALAFAASGCGGSSPTLQRTLDTKLKKRVAATCSTALSLSDKKLVLATFTVSWDHGSSAHTWFVFLRSNGTIDHVSREGEAAG